MTLDEKRLEEIEETIDLYGHNSVVGDMGNDLLSHIARLEAERDDYKAKFDRCFDSHQERLNERDAAREEARRLREALEQIRNGRDPHVCGEYIECDHVGCRASYAAFVIADKALAAHGSTG